MLMAMLDTFTLANGFMGASTDVWIGALTSMAGLGVLVATVRMIKRDRDAAAHGVFAAHANARTELLARSRKDRLLTPALRVIARPFLRLVRPSWLQPKSNAGPGLAVGPGGLLAIRVGLTVLGLFSAIRLGAGFSPGVRLATTLFVAVICWAIPSLYLARVADARVTQLDRELPDLLDQITISLSAGLGIDAAISRVADAGGGVLAEELKRTMADIRVGVDRTVAFENLAERSRSDDVAMVTSAIVQGIELGTSLTPVLVARAADLRRRRRAAAEEKAHKLSVQLALPTAICILPALMLVVIGPALLQVIGGF